MFISIFTPTYNRGYILPKLYESIKRQVECGCGFEWVIVDDGSTDNTPDLVEGWLADGDRDFEIRYFRQPNSGKHVAWNKGAAEAAGDVFFPVDSDDHLTDDALARIVQMFATIDDPARCIGVSGTRAFPDGNTGGILNDPGTDYIDYLSIDRRSKGISGDLAEAFYTDKIRQYPLPVIDGEKFAPEAIIFNRFSSDGLLIRGFSYPLYCCEYLSDGYTRNVDKLLIANWEGYKLYVRELMASKAGLKAKAVPLAGFIYRWVLKKTRIVK